MADRPAARSAKARSTARRPTAAEVEADRREVRIFVSYSHADDAFRVKLERHLAPLKREGVATWFDGDMDAGDELDPGIARAMRRAHLFVALISPHYLDSDYCWNKEYARAMRRRARGTLRVIGVVLKPCDWKRTTAARFKQLPKDGRAVSDWRSADHAFLDVTSGVRDVVKAIRRELEVMPLNPAKRPRSPLKAKPKPRPATKAAEPRATIAKPNRKLTKSASPKASRPAGTPAKVRTSRRVRKTKPTGKG